MDASFTMHVCADSLSYSIIIHSFLDVFLFLPDRFTPYLFANGLTSMGCMIAGNIENM
jgi:hypothetical protein